MRERTKKRISIKKKIPGRKKENIRKINKCQKHKLITRKYQKGKEKKEKMNLKKLGKIWKSEKIPEKMDAYWIPNI